MALTIASREVDGVTVLDLSGRITLGEGSVQLREAVRDLISKGSRNILLNMSDVNYIDSSGLGELVSAFTTAKNQGASVKLLGLTKKVKDVLQLTKLYTVFDVYEDEAGGISVVQVVWIWNSAPMQRPSRTGWPLVYGECGLRRV